jgi:hypothetical protein
VVILMRFVLLLSKCADIRGRAKAVNIGLYLWKKVLRDNQTLCFFLNFLFLKIHTFGFQAFSVHIKS